MSTGEKSSGTRPGRESIDLDIHRRIADAMNSLSQVSAADGVSDVLQGILASAVGCVDAAESASVSLVSLKKQQLTVCAVTDEQAQAHTDIQNRHDEGACWDAVRSSPVVYVEDLRAEDRWPAYLAEAVEQLPFRSVLSLRLSVGNDEVLGSLSLFSRRPEAFDADARQLGEIFATHCAGVIASAQRGVQLTYALQSRDVISQAKGMIMERFRIDSTAAFALITKLSQDSNTKVAEIARSIIDAEGLESSPA